MYLHKNYKCARNALETNSLEIRTLLNLLYLEIRIKVNQLNSSDLYKSKSTSNEMC